MVSITLTETTCWCGTPFAVPTRMYNSAYNDGHTIYCPHGHTVVWKETQADKLRHDRDRLKQQITHRDDLLREARADAEHQERRAAAFKGSATKLRKRAKAGICPCCTRSFVNLKRHMDGQHPDWHSDEPELRVISGGKK